MFDPEADLDAIYRVFSLDDHLLELLGYTSGTKSDYIWRNDEVPQSIGKSKLCFYHAPSRRSLNDLCSIEIIQFDAHVPVLRSYEARNIQRRIAELVKKHRFNGHKLQFVGQLGNIATTPGFTCVASRYSYPIVI